MGYQAAHPGYRVRVDGLELGQTQYAIQATVDYASQLTTPERERFVPKAQLELLMAVLGEWERAVRLGARNVRIAVLGDGHLDRFFRSWVNGPLAPDDPEGPALEGPSPRGRTRRSAPASSRSRSAVDTEI